MNITSTRFLNTRYETHNSNLRTDQRVFHIDKNGENVFNPVMQGCTLASAPYPLTHLKVRQVPEDALLADIAIGLMRRLPKGAYLLVAVGLQQLKPLIVFRCLYCYYTFYTCKSTLTKLSVNSLLFSSYHRAVKHDISIQRCSIRLVMDLYSSQ